MMSLRNEVDSNSGFFRERHIHFRKGLTDCDVKNFANLKTDEERFTFVLNKHVPIKYPINLTEQNKNEEYAKDFKDKGNKAFQKESYNMALFFYTKSLQQYPSNNPENIKDKAITRANRSAALYHAGKYNEALKDIEIAESSGYPKDLLYKVKDRKARCLLALKQHVSALKAFQETITALDDAKLKTESKQKLQRDVQIMISMMTQVSAKNEKISKKIENEKLAYKENPVYRAACDAVAIRKDDIAGRYAIATRDIQIGEILLVEQPHCAVLLQEYVSNNCFQCFKRIEVGEPCTCCSRVIFCSTACQKIAWDTHHKVECNILQTLWESGLSITCLMALRVISQHPPEYFQNLQLTDSVSLWDKGVYKSADYNTIYNLVRHETKRKLEDTLHRANIAVFLFQCLKAGKYFSEKDDEKTEKLIGGLLLRHLQILQFNAHEVSELRVQGKGYANCKSTFIGGAVFPTLALFNHSCNPSITRYFKGTTVVTRAIRNLKAGENISENYGPMFTQTKKEERQMTLLNQYWFSCECEACMDNWPEMDNMDITTLPFRCSGTGCGNIIKVPLSTTNCMIICGKCSKNNNIMRGLKVLQDTENIFRLGMAYLEEGEAEEALKKFLELYRLVNEVLAPPFKDYHLCQQAIRTCFLTRGNQYQIQNSNNK